jgi:N-acetylmuramoyl-L-alanine amidase
MIMVLAVVVVAGTVTVAVAVPDASAPPGAPPSAGTVRPPANPTLAASPGGTELDPSMFEPGSCVAFSPLSGDRHQTVFLDAGHGGIDPGASGVTESGATIHEADETLPVELEAANLLRAQCYRVVLSRTRASTVLRPGSGDVATGIFSLQGEHDDVAARDVCANLAKATILLGIYFDAGTSSTDAGSVTGYDTVRPFSADNQRLATLLQTDVLAHLNARGWTIPNDGVVSDATLGGPAQTTTAANYDHLLLLGPADPGWFTTPSQMPGALIEPLFITDPFEGTIASSPRGQQAIAEGMAQAAEQYLGQGSASASAAGHAA